jgi:hypothetical protein
MFSRQLENDFQHLLLENEACRHLQMFSIFTPLRGDGAAEHRRPTRAVGACRSRGGVVGLVLFE